MKSSHHPSETLHARTPVATPRPSRRSRLGRPGHHRLPVLPGPAGRPGDVSTKIAAFPYDQDWSNGALITANDDWSGVTGVQGYLGGDVRAATGTDPQTRHGARAACVDRRHRQRSRPGHLATAASSRSTATRSRCRAAARADAPNLVFHLDLTGMTGTQFSFDARDIDGRRRQRRPADRGPVPGRRIAATTRTCPAGYIADATTGPSLATLVTHRDVALPAATDGQADVYVRVMTTNAAGTDEWVGIDNVAITTGARSRARCTATNPGDKTGTVGSADHRLRPRRDRRHPAVHLGRDRPARRRHRRPTTARSPARRRTGGARHDGHRDSATDSAADAGTDDETFTWTVTAAAVGSRRSPTSRAPAPPPRSPASW